MKIGQINKFLALFFVFVSVSVFFLFNSTRHHNQVTFLDVGQGDAIFIDIDGFQILIDGGGTLDILGQLRAVMPLFDRSIDMVIATHPDSDHLGGLPEVLHRFEVAYIMDNGMERMNDISSAWNSELYNQYEKGAKYMKEEDIDILHISEDVRLVFFPSGNDNHLSSNNQSVVVKLETVSQSFLFTGDIEKEREEILVNEYGPLLQSDVLKVSHHGSQTSSIKDFLNTVSPTTSVISAGCDNRYGHPHKSVIDRLEKISEVFSTCARGRIGVTIQS
jgi:competence protein ComEC